MTEEKKLRIEYGERPKVLFTGNGFNRAFDFASWDELLKDIKCRELTDEEENSLDYVPYPLRTVILSGENIGNKLKEQADKLSRLKADKEEEDILKRFLNLPFDSILTTNYTYEFEKAVDPEFKCKTGCASRYRMLTKKAKNMDENRQLRTYFKGNGENQTIWHIHGEAAKSDTMIIGHYYYGKLLAKMQNYVSDLNRRYHGNRTRKQAMEVYSWIDYFMLGDVYITAQGLELAELDLWWLINCKKRNFPDTKIILYKSDIRTEQKLLAEAYNVDVIDDAFGITFDKDNLSEGFRKYYLKVADKMEERL